MKRHLILASLAVGFLIGASALSALATGTWSPAPSNPPSNNVDAPINVGSALQEKLGSLLIDNNVGIIGNLIIATGTPSAGKVLTAVDGTGTVVWTATSSLGITSGSSGGNTVPSNSNTTSYWDDFLGESLAKIFPTSDCANGYVDGGADHPGVCRIGDTNVLASTNVDPGDVTTIPLSSMFDITLIANGMPNIIGIGDSVPQMIQSETYYNTKGVWFGSVRGANGKANAHTASSAWCSPLTNCHTNTIVSVPTSGWHKYGIRKKDANTIQYLVDGVVVATNTTNIPNSGMAMLFIGGGQGGPSGSYIDRFDIIFSANR